MNLIKFGNHKLGDDIAIFNMSSATDCPSRKLGLCDVVKEGKIRCYAEKPEIQYKPNCLCHRRHQEEYWKNTSGIQILEDFYTKITKRRKETRYFRYNEAGDFHLQEDINKLSLIADGLRTIGITTYGYTARYDLDFSDRRFIVRGSGFFNEYLNGTTTVITKNQEPPEGYIVCPGNCRRCNICKSEHLFNIAFRAH